MPDTQAPPEPGLTWASLTYEHGSALAGLSCPEKNDRCETHRHPFAQPKPRAAWVEMVWHPATRQVARCWKTCESCHGTLVRTAGRIT